MLAKAEAEMASEVEKEDGKVIYVASGKLPGGGGYHFLNWPSAKAIAEFQAGLICLGETLGEGAGDKDEAGPG